ncbi:CAP-Gly domain-containing linker protein 4 [Mortierella sp. GBA30]|nr:CAP-Gly domain-containing linker protein 4 [Mortierella sp. GBA30]
MAPKTPQGTSKTPRSPSAGSPIPLTGIPGPASVLQRRSLGQSQSSSKSFQNMSPEQQSLLAEAISIHSPGLIDSARNRADSVGSASSTSGTGTSINSQSYQPSPVPTSFSPGIASIRTNSPTAPTPPLSYRSSQTRRTSASGAATTHSATSPLTTASLQNSSASSSPTAATAAADSSSISRISRLSMGSSPAGGASTRLAMKQPLFHRPPSTDSSSASFSSVIGATNSNSASHLLAMAGLPAPHLHDPQGHAEGQNQLPASLEGIELGDRVVVESMGLSGYLRFVGTTEFKTGVWAGIELDTPTGKNDGSVGEVVYFTCRPKCGIFVLAAKIVKTELLIPFSSVPAPATRPPSVQEDAHTTPPPTLPTNHAAQAAARITAGSRASKYIGVTASQLKQRHGMPQPANSRLSAQQQQQQQQQQQTATRNNITGSPTSVRTLSNGTINTKTTSPTPTIPTGRAGLGSRLSQPGSKTSLLSMTGNNIKSGTLSRSGSSATASPPGTMTNRPRTSPTPVRLMPSPRRLSSRASDTSDNGNQYQTMTSNNSNSHSGGSMLSSPNLLDQAMLVQMAESPQSNLTVQLQQLQLDFGVAIAENNMLKTEMNQTKSQLEMTRLLEKRDLSYDERVFLSKSLGRGGIDERLGQELEDLHSMKEEWEKEKNTKDHEIKVITDKMTEAWLEAARSQKEKTALMQEKEELEQRLKELKEGVEGSRTSEQSPVNEEQQLEILSLTKDLREAEEKTTVLKMKLQDLEARADEAESRLREREEILTETRIHYAEQLTLLEQDRDDLQVRLDDLEVVLKVTTEALQSKLEAALRDTAHSEEQLHEVQARLEHEADLRRAKESDSENQLKQMEAELQESHSLLIKSEKLARDFEEKAKEYESTVARREQEIFSLRSELDDLAGMVQSDEVDRMRKVWENEKKRLEEEVAENKTVITDLRAEIQSLKSNEESLLDKITDLESAISMLSEAKEEMQSAMTRLQIESDEAQEVFVKERADLQSKIDESEKTIETQAAEIKDKIENLEAIAQTVETWKEQCQAMQLEMIQKTAKAEEVGFELSEAIAQRDEASALKKELEDKISQLSASHLDDLEKIQVEHKSAQEERSGFLTKISELQAALALSASVQAKTSSAEGAAHESSQNPSDQDEQIAQLKKMVHDLTRENVTVASVNKKLMQEHDNLMEAHKHVETECLKLMDEVERLHAESLAAASMDGESEAAEEKDEPDSMENTEPKAAAVKDSMTESHGPPLATQSQSVIRLEGLLKEKQALLDRLTQVHSAEMRDIRQRYVDLDRSKAYELGQLNKELTELESLIESKIFHEADLEEEVQRKQKQIDRLQHEVSELKRQLMNTGSTGLFSGSSPAVSSYQSEHRSSSASIAPPRALPSAERQQQTGDNRMIPNPQALFCEICEVEGHDIITCSAVFGARNNKAGNKTPVSSLNSTSMPPEMEDERPYCENCEEFGLHYTDECPNESLTY